MYWIWPVAVSMEKNVRPHSLNSESYIIYDWHCNREFIKLNSMFGHDRNLELYNIDPKERDAR